MASTRRILDLVETPVRTRPGHLRLPNDAIRGDIRFEGTRPSSFASLMPERTVLLGSFSKTVVPSFRPATRARQPERHYERTPIVTSSIAAAEAPGTP